MKFNGEKSLCIHTLWKVQNELVYFKRHSGVSLRLQHFCVDVSFLYDLIVGVWSKYCLLVAVEHKKRYIFCVYIFLRLQRICFLRGCRRQSVRRALERTKCYQLEQVLVTMNCNNSIYNCLFFEQLCVGYKVPAIGDSVWIEFFFQSATKTLSHCLARVFCIFITIDALDMNFFSFF